MRLNHQVIRDARRRLGHTQAEAAAAVGVATNTWARWERGERTPTAGPGVAALKRYLSRSRSTKSPSF